jgi:hypothetical protein
MIRELRTVVITEERHPNEQDIWDAWNFANEKRCYVELKWFTPHFGWKTWFIDPDKHTIADLLTNLHITTL